MGCMTFGARQALGVYIADPFMPEAKIVAWVLIVVNRNAPVGQLSLSAFVGTRWNIACDGLDNAEFSRSWPLHSLHLYSATSISTGYEPGPALTRVRRLPSIIQDDSERREGMLCSRASSSVAAVLRAPNTRCRGPRY
jgi:hypothetical protein